MNLLLLISDSLRAKNTPLHGYGRDTTPFLNKLREDSISYQKAIAPSIWSLPSHASIFTGLHAQEHQLYQTNSALGGYETIWENLRRQGYKTGVFSRNIFITQPQYGLVDGFDHIDSGYSRFDYPFEGIDPEKLGSTEKLRYLSSALKTNATVGSLLNGFSRYLDSRGYLPDRFALEEHSPARGHVDRFLDWSESVDGEWAGCINFMSTHHDYTPLPEYNSWATREVTEVQNELEDQVWSFCSGQRPWSEREALMNLYDGAVRQVDDAVEYLYKELHDRGDVDDTIVIFTSDHGEGFGEYSEVRKKIRLAGHRFGIDDALIHVPLLIHSPEHGRETIKQPVSLTGIGKAFKKGSPDNFDTADIQKIPAISAVDITDRLSYDVHGDKLRLDFNINLDEYNGLAQAGYDIVDGEILKYAIWGNHSLESPIQEEIEEIWEELSDHKVSKDAFVNEETKTRLEELGYL